MSRRPAVERLLVPVVVLVAATLALALIWSSGPRGDLTAGVSMSGPMSTRTVDATQEATPTPSRAVPARRAAPRAEAPSSLRLPSGTTVPVLPAGTTTDGVLDVPDDIRTAGWWRGGSRLGDPFGSTLIAAHIDSRTQGLGPYAELLDVGPGDRVVLRSSGLVQQFSVLSRRLVPRSASADVVSLADVSGPRRLTLVTCAGPYDADHGGYQNLAVVTARPVTQPAPRRSRR